MKKLVGDKVRHLQSRILLAFEGSSSRIAQAVVLLVLALNLACTRVAIVAAMATSAPATAPTAGGTGATRSARRCIALARSAVVTGSTRHYSVLNDGQYLQLEFHCFPTEKALCLFPAPTPMRCLCRRLCCCGLWVSRTGEQTSHSCYAKAYLGCSQ